VSIPVDNIDDNVYSDTTYAVHFDAKKMAEYLQSVGISRGIKTISGKIEDVLLDRDGFVTDIILDTKQTIKTDFVFDCTGFARFFVNKIYNSPTVSYEKILPVKRAMPFFLDNTDITPSYTEAIAMKYGWMWKIPVGKRYGCGYVFDSDYVTDEEAYEEICEITKQRPYVPRKITFKPEYNTKPLNKNTLALGLAHGFLEPLEATSLMITIFMLKVLHSYNIFNRNEIESRTETYNNSVLKYVENCVEMVYIHYLTPREDTEFWQKFKNMIPISVENTLNKIENFDIKNPDPELMYMSPFNIHNILKCMGGVDYVKRDTIERNMGTYTYSKLKNYIEEIQNICKKSKNHDEYINEITNI
jgi:tryptophan halogenase